MMVAEDLVLPSFQEFCANLLNMTEPELAETLDISNGGTTPNSEFNFDVLAVLLVKMRLKKDCQCF
jgi:hypothetical protein